MDPMLMLRTSVCLFVLAALGGLAMAGIRFAGRRNPPVWLSMVHGLVAAAGVTLLAYAAATAAIPGMATMALLLFLVAAGGGAAMALLFQWRQRLLPAWLVVVHAALAVLGFVMLAVAAFA